MAKFVTSKLPTPKPWEPGVTKGRGSDQTEMAAAAAAAAAETETPQEVQKALLDASVRTKGGGSEGVEYQKGDVSDPILEHGGETPLGAEPELTPESEKAEEERKEKKKDKEKEDGSGVISYMDPPPGLPEVEPDDDDEDDEEKADKEAKEAEELLKGLKGELGKEVRKRAKERAGPEGEIEENAKEAHKEANKVRQKAKERKDQATKDAADQAKADANKAANRKKRDALADNFDPNAEERFDDEREILEEEKEAEEERIAIKAKGERERLEAEKAGTAKDQAAREEITKKQRKEEQKRIEAERKALAKETERKEKEALANFKDTLRVSIKGIQTGLRRDVADIEKDIARGGLYQKVEAAEKAARQYAAAAVSQGMSLGATRSAAFAKASAQAARTAGLNVLQEKITSFTKVGKLLTKQLRAASAATSFKELEGIEATYDSELERMLDELYERN